MKKIALINDLSGFGKCSLTAAIPVISVMGIQACPLPTAVLSAQTGFESYYCDDYTDRMNYFTDEWKKMQVTFDGIYSGYLAGKKQIEKVHYFLDKFQTDTNLYFLDPIMGDHGKRFGFANEELLEGMRSLAKRADVITPNLTELCLLADEDYEMLASHRQEEDYTKRIQSICEKLISKVRHEQKIVVTGIIREQDNREYIGNLAVSKEETTYIELPYNGRSFSGTGDLFSSVICGCLVKGESLKDSVKKAVDFLQTAIQEASEENIPSTHGVQFEKYLYRLM